VHSVPVATGRKARAHTPVMRGEGWDRGVDRSTLLRSVILGLPAVLAPASARAAVPTIDEYNKGLKAPVVKPKRQAGACL
jgi:predicted Zn-dependent protease